MFPARYFPTRFFAARYWPKVGDDQAIAVTNGLEFSFPNGRLHYSYDPAAKLHFSYDTGRLHFSYTDEDQ